MRALGDFIGGRFQAPAGEALISVDPARDGAPVLETAWDVARIGLACESAADAARSWAARSLAERWEALTRFRAAIAARADALADALVRETGKLRSEARGEVQSLLSRFELVRARVQADLAGGELPGHPGEELRFHPLGVVGVIGPFNYPLHLCHAHLVPALLTGNAVVVKPSEVTPLCAQTYAEAAEAAGLPPGLLNLVQGRGEAGAALASHPAVRGLCFTGSYAVGQKLSRLAAERPELLLALEMGGKNTVVVLEDADLPQAAHEIVVGGYLTTGQRCTCTDRVLVHESREAELVEVLRAMVSSLRMGDPEAADSFAGPMTTAAGRERFEAALARARAAGAEPVVAGGRLPGGFYARPSVHRLGSLHHVPGYTDTELFGPDLSVESVADDDEAIAVLQASPYGFANSVFTFSDERFERFYRETHSGILNRNRSTNMASPRLPFGGLGKSGNYRPAGAYAARNTVAAVAVQRHVIGRVAVHPQLAAHMPPPELDRLEAQHRREEAAEAARTLLDQPRPMRVELPRAGALHRSSEWLTRLYAADRVVREKKPPVFDHLRSAGPYLVSVDDPPLSVLDGMSQTATLCGGFGEHEVVRAYTEGAFANTLTQSADTAAAAHPAAEAYATVLRQLVAGVPEVSFANSGAEANEKALALARLHAADPERQRKVLAFEGSFHGRTLLALHATWNPAKRAAYELAGYEAAFAPFPVWQRPGDGEPAAPPGFYAAAGHGDVDSLQSRFGDAGEDALLAAEVASLIAVDQALRTGEIFACIVEPMQSEGGDRYATQRFYRALRLLTRARGVALIFDEVQTGFALGGPFAWHSAFNLVNVRGQPDYPDAVTFAKRAQVGVCMSVWPDPEPTSAHPASLVRGRLHAEMVSMSHHAERIQKLVEPRLETLARGFPHLVGSPRCRGYALAFDLPSAEHLSAYLGQRFWRGAVVFGAGSRTVRYRLSEGYLAREIDVLFDSIRRSLAWLDAHPGAQPPAWEDRPAAPEKPRDQRPSRVRQVGGAEALALLPAILDIEYRVYEPARRTPPEEIRAALENPESLVHVAEIEEEGGWHFVGFGIGHPLEAAAKSEEGPDRDPMTGRENTLYSMSLTVSPECHGLGLGRRLKEAQLRDAAAVRRQDGRPRFRYVTGRNRVGLTAAMAHLNRAYGAHVVDVLTGQYEDPEGQAIYYRIPLPPWAPEPGAPAHEDAVVDLAQGIARPFARPPESLRAAEQSGLLYGPAVNKLTIMNYTTPAAVRALEWVGSLAPSLPHMYLTSCRDECVDKTLRLLKTHRKDATVAIGLVGGYVGHTTAAARSLSDPALHRQGPAHFSWPLLPHPADIGVEASLAILREIVADAGGPDRVLGLFAEPLQERSGRTAPAEFWDGLAAVRRELGIPLVAVETASACYRSGLGAFASSALPVEPDVLIWWGGAQTGYLHVKSELRVATPLALVSTWDGDELSLVREHHQLRAARTVDLSAGIAALDEAMAAATEAGLHSRGLGLYRVIEAKARGETLAAALAERGVRVRSLPGGRLAIAPPLDAAEAAARRLGQALKEIL